MGPTASGGRRHCHHEAIGWVDRQPEASRAG
jgi:hypothetical protein